MDDPAIAFLLNVDAVLSETRTATTLSIRLLLRLSITNLLLVHIHLQTCGSPSEVNVTNRFTTAHGSWHILDIENTLNVLTLGICAQNPGMGLKGLGLPSALGRQLRCLCVESALIVDPGNEKIHVGLIVETNE